MHCAAGMLFAMAPLEVVFLVSLKKAALRDCHELFELQTKSFQALLEKYQDHATNPGGEKLQKTKARLKDPGSDYYLICLGDTRIGAVRIVTADAVCRLQQIYILPAYQGNGYAQQAIRLAESLHPNARCWELDTIKEEAGLCRLYEKMGYRRTGKEQTLQEGMTLVFYAKRCES